MSKNKKNEFKERESVSNAPTLKVKSKRDTLNITAKENAKLPDGTFVAKGESVEVSAEFVERLKREDDKSFIIN